MIRRSDGAGDSWTPSAATVSIMAAHYDSGEQKADPGGWTTVQNGKRQKAKSKKSKRPKANPKQAAGRQPKTPVREKEHKHSPRPVVEPSTEEEDAERQLEKERQQPKPRAEVESSRSMDVDNGADTPNSMLGVKRNRRREGSPTSDPVSPDQATKKTRTRKVDRPKEKDQRNEAQMKAMRAFVKSMAV